MATVSPTDFAPNSIRRLSPEKYVSLGDFIDEINAPDNRDALVKTYGDQGITGFLQLTGAVKSNGTADQVQYWEETRLHPAQKGTPAASAAADATAFTMNMATNTEKPLRVNDVILVGGVDRFIVTAVAGAGETTYAASATATCHSLLTGGLSANLAASSANFPIVGNLFAQGTSQNSGYLESNVVKRTNPYMIIKETYKVTGSQATNVGWINLGNGDYRWYIKSENDTRQRFIDKREMMMLLGQQITNTGVTGYGDGSEGYFSAIENRGIVTTAASGSEQAIHDIEDLDSLIVALDKQGAAAEYAVYCDRAQDLKFDDIIAAGTSTADNITAGVASQFGAFNNDKDMAIKLGFSSFMRGSYGFHKHSWKLLNEPTLLAGSKYQGAMIPLTTVSDPKTGTKAAALEMNYKSSNGYSREMEHWMTGSILGVSNTNDDSLQFNYRTECNLVTRAANQHVILKKA